MRIALPTSLAALSIAASLFATGCGKSPESVCKKLDEILKDDKEKSKDRDEAKAKKQMEECTKELTEIKTVSPKGYDCIVGCTEYKTAGAAMGCLAECQEKDDKLKEHRKKKREEEEKDRAKQIVEWTKAKDKTFDGTFKDYDDKKTSFSITLVEGFEDKSTGDSFKSYEIENKETFTSAHLNLMTYSKMDADKQEEGYKKGKKKVIKKEVKDEGWIFQLEDEGEFGGIEVDALIKVGDKFIKCDANIYNSSAKQFKDDLLPWLAKLCGSVKAK